MNEPMDNQMHIDHLAATLLQHKRIYYTGDIDTGRNVSISDANYDALEQELRDLVPDHPALSQIGTKSLLLDNSSQRVITNTKVAHRVAMLSLDKTYSVTKILEWAAGHDVVATYKLDGNSLSLIYKKGVLHAAQTRGDGRFGEDVTEKMRAVSACLNSVVGTAWDDFEVRGELYCTQLNFFELSAEMSRRDLSKPSNPRNIVAGMLGRKEHLDLCQYFSFAAFDLLLPDGTSPFTDDLEKFAWLQSKGFSLPVFELLPKGANPIPFLDSCREFMSEGDYGIDGAVFTYNDISLQKEMGNTAHHPRYKLSLKWQGETARAVITSLTWATSRLGIVTPVAVIAPVVLSGATITNVTLHNAAMVNTHALKVGDEIEIVRSGEVIPKFLRVIKTGDGDSVLPTICPTCNSILTFDEVRLRCHNKSCAAQQLGQILNWIKNAKIDDLSEKRVQSMLELKLIENAADLYLLDVKQLLTIPLTQDKMANKLFNNIQKSKSLTLVQFLSGLGIMGAGKTTWASLLGHFSSLGILQQASTTEIAAIDGFAETSAEQIVTGLANQHRMIQRLLDVGVSPTAPKIEQTATGVFSGQQFVLTGTMRRPRVAVVGLIEQAGGKVVTAVSGKVTALIIADINSISSKANKARKLNIPLWSEQDLEDAAAAQDSHE